MTEYEQRRRRRFEEQHPPMSELELETMYRRMDAYAEMQERHPDVYGSPGPALSDDVYKI